MAEVGAGTWPRHQNCFALNFYIIRLSWQTTTYVLSKMSGRIWRRLPAQLRFTRSGRVLWVLTGRRSVGYDPVSAVVSYLSTPSCEYLLGSIWVQGVSFIVILSMVALLHRMPAFAGTSHDSCGQDCDERNSLYYRPIGRRCVQEAWKWGRNVSYIVTMPTCT
jgi:hypothetical protein